MESHEISKPLHYRYRQGASKHSHPSRRIVEYRKCNRVHLEKPNGKEQGEGIILCNKHRSFFEEQPKWYPESRFPEDSVFSERGYYRACIAEGKLLKSRTEKNSNF